MGMRRIPKIQARLDEWAVWVCSGSGGGGASHPLARLMDWKAGRRVTASGDGGFNALIPMDEIECSLTDDAVQALPAELQQAVRAWHCAREGTLETIAAQLFIVKTTLWRRLAQADQRIDTWLTERRTRSRDAV
jgi:hypothetical protein